MKQTQLLKGVLEGCVLAVISINEVYGYELVQILRSNGFANIVAGTVYPLLQKLEKQGHIIGDIRPSPDGPDRKYYSITAKGEEYFLDFLYQWESLVGTVDHLIKLKGGYLDGQNESGS